MTKKRNKLHLQVNGQVMKQYSEFNRLAEQAVNAEQTGNYHDAALFWQDASMTARLQDNLEWALARKEYCEHQRFRGRRAEKIQ